MIVSIEKIYINYAPLFNEFSVNLDESGVVKFYNLDKIDIEHNPKPFTLILTTSIGNWRQRNLNHYKYIWVHQLLSKSWSKQFSHTYWGENYKYAWWKRWCR